MTPEHISLERVIIDRLSEIEKRMETNRVENRADHLAIESKIEALQTSGCAVGQRNAEAIHRLEHRPERALGMGAAVASVLACIGAIVSAIIASIGNGR
jgi:hypothetical protein